MSFVCRVYVNANRNYLAVIRDPAQKRAEARRMVALLLLPRDLSTEASGPIQIPDHLVSDSMVDRYLAIEPPVLQTIPDFDAIIREIECSYVLGNLFSALSAAAVSTERMLNQARIKIHEFVSPKIKELWGKGAVNSWDENISALQTWGYLSSTLADELSALYQVRCDYLHSRPITALEEDAPRMVRGAYDLLKAIIGFPAERFVMTAGEFRCLNPADPLFKAFYLPGPFAA